MSKGALRYRNEGDMPASVRKAYAASLRGIRQPLAPSAQPKEPPRKPAKYGAVPTTVDGIRFDSKREARYYEALKLRVAAGEILFFLRQVPIHLPGGTKLVVDFQEFHADGSVRFVDTKGRETEAFKIKRREVEAAYPIKILLA